jgi:hypothetical protein
MSSQDVHFPGVGEKGRAGSSGSYQLPRRIFESHLPTRLVLSLGVGGKLRIFFSFLTWGSTVLGTLVIPSCFCSTLRLSKIASCASFAVMPCRMETTMCLWMGQH